MCSKSVTMEGLLWTDNEYFEGLEKTNHKLLETELSLHYPPWLGEGDTNLWIVRYKRQKLTAEKTSSPDGHRSTLFLIDSRKQCYYMVSTAEPHLLKENTLFYANVHNYLSDTILLFKNCHLLIARILQKRNLPFNCQTTCNLITYIAIFRIWFKEHIVIKSSFSFTWRIGS